MIDNSLKHYGVIGMKWGKRKAARIQSKSDKMARSQHKLEKSLNKMDSKVKKVETEINKQKTKIDRKMMFTINKQKREKLAKKLNDLNDQILEANKPVEVLKVQVERTKRMKDLLDKELSSLNNKYDKKFFEELSMLDNKKDIDKIESMKREREKYKNKIRSYN